MGQSDHRLSMSVIDAVRHYLRPEPVPLSADERAFLTRIGKGWSADDLERDRGPELRSALARKLVRYDSGAYTDPGWYVVTRLGHISLAHEDT